MNVYLLSFVIACVLFLGVAHSEEKNFSPDPFAFGEENTLLLWKNEPLIIAERFNYFDKNDWEAKAEHAMHHVAGATVKNLWHQSPKFSFRRELAVFPNEAEGTVEILLSNGWKGKGAPRSGLMYEFEVPLVLLGDSYTAIIGRSYSTKVVTGNLATDPLPPSVRWITFHTQRGDLSFDFNPKGVTSDKDFGTGDSIGLWSIRREGKNLYFGFGGSAPAWGCNYSSKWRVFQGGMEEYDNRHFYRSHLYFSSMSVLNRFLFGGGKPKEKSDIVIQPVQVTPTQASWKDGETIQSVKLPKSGLYDFSIASTSANTFQFPIAQSGIYIITLQSIAEDNFAKKMQIAINGRTLVPSDAPPLSAGTLQTITFAEHLEAGMVEINFSGDWTISTLTLQPLLHAREDFLTRRGVWLDESVPEITPVNRNRNHDPLKWAVDFQRENFVFPPKGPVVLSPRSPWRVHHPDPRGLEWRYTAILKDFGPSNYGTFTEFSTREEIAHHLDELQSRGVGLIQINGFLARHLAKDQRNRIWEQLKIIVEEAHKRGIKVADHQDVSLLWNNDEGFRHLIENIGMLQRTYKGNVPTWGLSIVNPDFKERFFQEMIALVKATDIDALMLDEASFHGKEFDFSPAAREQFTRDTGLVMPLVESSPIYGNRDAPLWKVWLNWRDQAIAGWFAELRQQIEKIKPNFVLMCYTTDGGTSSAEVFLEYGGTLEEVAQANDMIGSEIMSRNVLENYRSTFSYRKLKSAFRSLNEFPIYGLVYTDHPEILEFGWALLNMNRQTLWTLSEAEFSQKEMPYLGWNSNMDLLQARPVADIGIAYSLATRNWLPTNQNPEAGGISQVLTASHIPHEFLYTESFVSRGIPSSLRLLILPDSGALSTEECKAILLYVQSGGRLLLTGRSGTYDEWGRSRDNPLAKQLRKAANAEADQNHFSLDKGEVWVTEGFIGVNNFDEDFGVGDSKVFQSDHEAATLCLETVMQARGKADLPYRIHSAPEALLTSAFSQPSSNGKQALVFHLLNAAGAVAKKGDVIKSEPIGAAFPPALQDVVIETAWPYESVQAFVVQPGSEEKTPLDTETLAEGRISIKVPAKWLSRYSLVFVQEPSTPLPAS